MCVDVGGLAADAAGSAPRRIAGDAVDPIRLEPVDEVVVTMLMDNSYDGLLPDTGPARRFGLARSPVVTSTVMEGEQTKPGLLAEHGFSALVTTRRGDTSHTFYSTPGSRRAARPRTCSASGWTTRRSKRSCKAVGTSVCMVTRGSPTP